jgi:hypothetical protein
MFVLNSLTFSAIAAGIALIFAFAWTRLPDDARQPVVVYVGSYFLTYCIGGTLIGLSDGEVLADYLGDRVNIPSVASFGAEYWYLLLAPLVVPVCAAAVLTRRWKKPIGSMSSNHPSRWQFMAVFAGLASFAIFRIFLSGHGVVNALLSITNLQGDSTTLVEKRMELFDTGTTVAFGILYSGLPALSHVALFKARETGKSWRVIAFMAVVTTVGLSIATFVIGHALVFIAALLVSATHLRWVRMTWAKAGTCGIAFLLLLQGVNSWKFRDWTFFENARHIVLRMPAAYLHYLDCFPATVRFLGTDWVGTLTGRGMDPGAPFIVSQFMYPGSIVGGAMAAPAHVQGYAEGGALNSMVCIAMIGVLIAGVALLRRQSRGGAISHGLYIQGLVMLYYSTQGSFRGVIWHGYGFVWSLLPLLLLGMMSLKRTVAGVDRRPVRLAPFHDRWRAVAAFRR